MDRAIANLFKKVKELEKEVIRLDKVKKDKDKTSESAANERLD